MKVLSISNNQNIASRGKGMNDSLEHLGNITKKSLGQDKLPDVLPKEPYLVNIY